MNLTGLKEVIPIATTVAATVAVVFSALAYRLERAKGRTVVEAQPLWHPRGSPAMAVIVRNLGDETLTVTAAKIYLPKGSTIAVDSHGLYGMTPAFNPPEQQHLEVNFPVFSLARTNGGSPLAVLNEAVIPLYFQPPCGWDGGWIKVRIALSSSASAAKPRWITVKRYLHKQSPLAERADARRPQEVAV
jgi:hypothetical protein